MNPSSVPNYKNFKLVNHYFGVFLQKLLDAQQETKYPGRFYLLAFHSEDFEERLIRIEPAGQTQAVINEIGDILDPIELDRRLMDVWAELRVIDLLLMEGFRKISKVRDFADLTAYCQEKLFAFQVKRIHSALVSEINRRNAPDRRNMQPYGTPDDIHERFDKPVSYYFWDALLDKNNNFRTFSGATRFILIVSGDENLQDPLVRHIACQQIRNGIHDAGMVNLHFEHLIWLPDTSPGAWFVIGNQLSETRCFADWKDTLDSFGWESSELISRREVDLDSTMNLWKDPEVRHKMCK